MTENIAKAISRDRGQEVAAPERNEQIRRLLAGLKWPRSGWRTPATIPA